MNVIGVIPARMGSTRFPGKPMKKMHGMPMIGHCYHRVALAFGVEKTFVATCDVEIYDYILSIGGKAIMTSNKHTRATTRTAEALNKIEEKLEIEIDIVVMIQGDEPLIHPDIISGTVLNFQDPDVDIANVMSCIQTEIAFKDENNVKVVVDNNNNALYFSREPIPSPWKGFDNIPKYMQTGIIAFRRKTLIKFNALKETQLEVIESIDMNRILETGGKIRMVMMESETIGVDTAEELIVAERMLDNDNVMGEYIKK